MPALSVIIPARDAQATLTATLDALAAQRPVEGGFEVVVADDASTDATRSIASDHQIVDRVIDCSGVGPGAARNAAVGAASGAILAFTDADCVPAEDWLVSALAEFDAGADVVQGAVEPLGEVGPFDRTVRVDQLSGLFETANLCVRAEWFQRAGGFESWLSPRASKELAEDAWLGWRMKRAGAQTVFAPQVRVGHAVFPGTPSSFVVQQLRLRFFPLLIARVPEMRAGFPYGGLFLSRRRAAFALAVAGVIAALIAGSPVPLIAALPYVPFLWRIARPWGRRGPLIAATGVVADAVGLAALIAGDIRARRVLL